MASEQFSLCWDNFHKNMSSGMNSLLENEDLVDVTLAVQGKCLKAHKMVLSVCSPYFKELFKSNPCQHPIVFMKDVSYEALSDLLQFMYQGEVQVSQENLTTFIKTAEALQIKGLTGDGNGSADSETVESVPEKPVHQIEEYKPSPRPKKQPAPILSTPSVKRPRLSVSSDTSQPLPPAITKTEPVASAASGATSESNIQFKMEPYDQSQSLIDDTGDETFGDDNMDDAAVDDSEDYSMMEGGGVGGEEEPQAGTSADGAGEGQGKMFKIVEITGRGLKHLTIVPSAWENNGQLSWPKVMADKLFTDVNSVPEGNWFRMGCKLKRNGLINYGIAEKELERLLANDVTEQEEVESIKRKKRPRMILQKTHSNDDNFNSLANACLLPLERTTESLTAATSEIFISQPMLGTHNNSYQLEVLPKDEPINSSYVTDTVTTSIDPQLNNKLDNILANQDTIIQKQQLIIDNFEHLASDRLASHSFNACSCQATNKNWITNTADIFLDPIENLEGLEILEAKLADKNVMEDYVQKFSYVCGRKGLGNGISNCYILVDKIFSRKFMTLCSWAGGARDKKEKIPFKMFKNVISLFFKVVVLSDEHFTLKDCEAFLKSVIRNSTKRNESSLVRSSRSKRRPRSLSYKVRRGKDETNENEDGDAADASKDENEIENRGNHELNSEKSQAEETADVSSGEEDYTGEEKNNM